MAEHLSSTGGNPGRSGHRMSVDASRVVFTARSALAGLFGLHNPSRVVFMHNATHALNLAIHGLIKPGDHVVTTGMEHNSVMRPLRALERDGVRVTVVPCDDRGCVDMEAMEATLRGGARLVIVNHASNVVGTIAPVAEVGRMAHESGAVMLVDAAQTAGVVPIDQREIGFDLLAFTGHKGLYGPTGTGGLVISESFEIDQLRPTVHGGTGSRSEHEEQPDMLPDRFESGTLNAVGIAGLGAAVRWIQDSGVEEIRTRESQMIGELIEGLSRIPGVRLYGLPTSEGRTAILSLRIDGYTVSEVGQVLDEKYGILTRVGLHCAPSAHRSIGTFPEGTVRLAPGVGTTDADILKVVEAIGEIAANRA